jgi:hypothetical protein
MFLKYYTILYTVFPISIMMIPLGLYFQYLFVIGLWFAMLLINPFLDQMVISDFLWIPQSLNNRNYNV